MFPAWDQHLLPTGQASYAKNGFLFSGSLIGWRKPKLLRALNNSAARMVFRVPTVSHTQARAYLVFKTQPNDGDTVIIGDLTYTFKTSLTISHGTGGAADIFGLPFEVLIGGTTLSTATHLAEAITADSGQNTNAGVDYGENTPLNGDVKYDLPNTDPITGLMVPTASQDTVDSATIYTLLGIGAEDFGAAFNLIKVAESTSNARVTWLYATNSFANTTTTFKGGTNPKFDNSITGSAAWLEFNDRDTDVVKSPVVEDQFDRFYFASPSDMPKYNTRERIAANSAPWLLGVPPPGCAVTLDVTGGGNSLVLGNNTEAELSPTTAKANRIYVIKVRPSGATQIQNVTIVGNAIALPDAGLPDVHWNGVIYADLNGVPDVLLSTGRIEIGVKADQLNISTFVNPLNLSANVDYWIGVSVDSMIFAFNGGPTTQGRHMASWPNTFTNGPSLTAPTTALAHSQVTGDGSNLVNGDSLLIGTVHYTFKGAIGAGDSTHVDVHIAGTADGTLTNLEHAINASGGTPGTDYSTGTTANPWVAAGAVVSHAIILTMLNAGLGDGSNVPTVFTPVGAAHISLPDTTLQEGYTNSLPEFEMYADCLTSDVIESRSYVYTWVSVYGEEGPPSPPTLLDGWSNGTWQLGLWQPPPDDLGVLRDLRKINIYRTVPGQGGATVFFFVKQVEIGTLAFTDNTPNNTVALNDQLQSTNWFPPPQTLQGLTVMQNGMVVSFKGNEVWFCEPYHPHAWPPQYVITVDFPVVGLGVTNGALVVCTNANPFVISGSAPASMSQIKCADANPCSSRASILSGDGAVTYCSPNGLIQVTAAAAATNTTDLWITREKWQQLTPQHDAAAILMSSCYYCLGIVSPDGTNTSVAQQGFTIELAQDNTSFTIWPQPGGHRLGLELLDAPVDNTDTLNVLTDPWTGTGLVVVAGNLYYFDFSDPAPTLKSYVWKSKLYQQNTKRNYTAMKVFFTVPPGTPTQNATRLEAAADDPAWGTLPTDRYGFVKTYVDKDNDGSMTLIDCREIRKSGEVLRVVDGFKADSYLWEIDGRVQVSNVQIGTSVKELARV